MFGNISRKQLHQETYELLEKKHKAITRVRELHKPRKTISGELCDGCETECDDPWESIHYISYPCKTIKALDGEQ